jgi:Bacterial alpha-L-rhamnosidase C-terminal domain
VPTPHGPLDADWSHPADGSCTLTLNAPPGTTGTVAVPTDGLAVTVRLNGRVLRARDFALQDGYAVLTGIRPGRHSVTVEHPRTHG